MKQHYTRFAAPPPWLYPGIPVNFALTNFVRKDGPPQSIKAIALDLHFEQYLGYTEIYTDGPKTSTETGLAIHIPVIHFSYSGPDLLSRSVFSMESLAILRALQRV